MLRLFKSKEISSRLEYVLVNPITKVILEVNILYITNKSLFKKETYSTQVNMRQISLKDNSSEIMSDIMVICADKYQIKALLEDEDFGCKILNEERNTIMNKIKYGYSF